MVVVEVCLADVPHAVTCGGGGGGGEFSNAYYLQATPSVTGRGLGKEQREPKTQLRVERGVLESAVSEPAPEFSWWVGEPHCR